MAWLESARASTRAAVLLAACVACSSSTSALDPTSAGGDASSDADSTSLSSPAATEPDSSTSSATSGLAPDGRCTDDSQCAPLECSGVRCHGCTTWQDCPTDLLCWRSECYVPDELPLCHAISAPVCGDGEIGALEECDGGAGCTECRRDAGRDVLIHDARIDDLHVGDDGVMLTRDNADVITRWDSRGTPIWSAPTELSVSSFATDAAGAIYLAGTARGVIGFPRVDAWETDATPRWTAADPEPGVRFVVAADDTRVVVGGFTEQDNSPWGRGFLAQYDLDGTVAWSRKLPEWSQAGAVVLDAGVATVLGVHLYRPIPWTLQRRGDAGEAEWSRDLQLDPNATSLSGLVGDGAGGTWIYGRLDEGPWALHHDAAGAEVGALECFGRTTGRIHDAAVSPAGAIAFAVLVAPGPIPTPGHRLWIAVLEGRDVTGGVVYDVGDERWDPIGLGWRPDGRLAIALRRYNPDDVVVLLVEV
jgi:hypothetical protein